ncbi:hypothetical protein XENOCAPTIV_007758 [Xenoophorus captivus]|uniref:Uncharacterized protein n=1 Tax=Xenoophorus captivus TaxID=1517983 RepID=A0ABV0RZR1_9TELE
MTFQHVSFPFHSIWELNFIYLFCGLVDFQRRPVPGQDLFFCIYPDDYSWIFPESVKIIVHMYVYSPFSESLSCTLCEIKNINICYCNKLMMRIVCLLSFSM